MKIADFVMYDQLANRTMITLRGKMWKMRLTDAVNDQFVPGTSKVEVQAFESDRPSV